MPFQALANRIRPSGGTNKLQGSCCAAGHKISTDQINLLMERITIRKIATQYDVMAEGARFELAVHEVDAGFQDRWFQPLTHPSDKDFRYLRESSCLATCLVYHGCRTFPIVYWLSPRSAARYSNSALVSVATSIRSKVLPLSAELTRKR